MVKWGLYSKYIFGKEGMGILETRKHLERQFAA